MIQVHQDNRVINKTRHVALGVNLAGQKEVLGLWVAETEGAKYWRTVLTELHNRGLKDVFIAGVDGLTGFPEAIQTVYLRTKVPLFRGTAAVIVQQTHLHKKIDRLFGRAHRQVHPDIQTTIDGLEGRLQDLDDVLWPCFSRT